MDVEQTVAIEAYQEKYGRRYVPGLALDVPLDALVFAEYQQPWLTLKEFRKARCHYDRETNAWLVEYVTRVLLRPDIPPIFIDVFDHGVALVDGAHRVTAHLIAGHKTVRAHLNKE